MPNASPVVLLHSSGMSARQWRRLADELPSRHRVIAPDFIGSGSGDEPLWPASEPFHFSQDVERIVALIEALDEPVHLVGHSYGGFVAFKVAQAIADRVQTLAAYDPVCFGVLYSPPDHDGLADLAFSDRPIFHDVTRGGDEAWFEVFVEFWNGPGAWQALPTGARQSFLRVGRKVFWEVTSLMADRTPAAAYAHITVPTLLLGGERSPVAARRVAAILAATLPHARLEMVAGAGHMGPLTHAPAVNAALLAHID